MKKIFLTLLLTILYVNLSAQKELNVLFLGNSYTSVNDLPGITAELLHGTDMSLHYDSNVPGGYTIFQHLDNTTSMSLIRKGFWDFVVIQEQSQLPTIDYYRETKMVPSYQKLCDSVRKYNECCMVVGYMTWGRRFGGQQCEDFGDGNYCSADFKDFNHMQDSLKSAYCQCAFVTDTYTAPVGMAWKKILEETDLVLHSCDNSHPSYIGSYLAACVLHSIFWNESPIGLYHNENIDDETALLLQQAANDVVFKSPEEWNFTHDDIIASFEYSTESNIVRFTNKSQGEIENIQYQWNFDDGTGSTEENPEHVYENPGTYNVTLTVSGTSSLGCPKSDSVTSSVLVQFSNVNEENDNGFTVSLVSENEIEIKNASMMNCSVKIFDIKGQIISQDEICGETSARIKCDVRSSGMYLVNIIDNQTFKIYTQKIVKP